MKYITRSQMRTNHYIINRQYYLNKVHHELTQAIYRKKVRLVGQ